MLRMAVGGLLTGLIKVSLIITSHKHLNLHKGCSDVTLPKTLKVKHALINLKGVLEGKCFKYSALHAIYLHKIHQNAKTYKKILDSINFENISELMNTKEDIDKFRRQNKKYTVSILHWEEEDNDHHPNKIAKKKDIKWQNYNHAVLVKRDDNNYPYLPNTNLGRPLNTQASYCNRT